MLRAFGHHVAMCCDMLGVVGSNLKIGHFQIWANNTQHVATHRNTVAKRTQHVAPNNVAICCVDMLRSFGRGFKFFVIRVRRLYEGGIYLKSNLFLANSSMVTEHLNFKKQKHVLVLVWKVIFKTLLSMKANFQSLFKLNYTVYCYRVLIIFLWASNVLILKHCYNQGK